MFNSAYYRMILIYRPLWHVAFFVFMLVRGCSCEVYCVFCCAWFMADGTLKAPVSVGAHGIMPGGHRR